MGRDIIQIPNKVIIPVLSCVFVVFILVCYIEHLQVKKLMVVEKATELRDVLIEEGASIGPGRGGICFGENRDSVISMSSELIGDRQCEKLWHDHGTKIIGGGPYYYRLGDLYPPYVLSKKANNDTIVAQKDGYVFMFLLDAPTSEPDDISEIYTYIKSLFKK